MHSHSPRVNGFSKRGFTLHNGLMNSPFRVNQPIHQLIFYLLIYFLRQGILWMKFVLFSFKQRYFIWLWWYFAFKFLGILFIQTLWIHPFCVHPFSIHPFLPVTLKNEVDVLVDSPYKGEFIRPFWRVNPLFENPFTQRPLPLLIKLVYIYGNTCKNGA